MDLKEFVTATLTQIVEGVAAAAPAVSAAGGAVSPAFSATNAGERMGFTLDQDAAPVYAVSFDVALVSSSTDTQEAGGALRVAGIGFGGKLGGSEKEEVTSRVQFMVPLKLPVDPTSAAAAQERRVAVAAKRKRTVNRLAADGGWMGG